MSAIEVESVPAEALAEPLELLAKALRDGEPVPDAFAAELRASVARGDTELLAARLEGRVVGVALIHYSLNVSAGGRFASIEEMQARPKDRGKGVGRALLEAVARGCAERGVSYVEVQTDDAAVAFYEACGFEAEPGVRVLSRSVAFDEDRKSDIRSL